MGINRILIEARVGGFMGFTTSGAGAAGENINRKTIFEVGVRLPGDVIQLRYG